jgi:hypothetical protein
MTASGSMNSFFLLIFLSKLNPTVSLDFLTFFHESFVFENKLRSKSTLVFICLFEGRFLILKSLLSFLQLFGLFLFL